MNFIETSTGILLNASAIRSLRPLKAGEPATDYYADAGDGREHLVPSYSAPKPGAIIPNANPEIVALTIWCDFDEAGEREGEPIVDEVPVVAWRVEASGQANPVTVTWGDLREIGASGGQLYALMDRRTGHCWSNWHEHAWPSRADCLKSLAGCIKRAVMAERGAHDALEARTPAS